jgi:hypothetical protein
MELAALHDWWSNTSPTRAAQRLGAIDHHQDGPGDLQPAVARSPTSGSVTTVVLSVAPSASPSGTLVPSMVIPSATTQRCSATRIPSTMSATRSSPDRSAASSSAAEFLVTGKQAHYLLAVKANQPTLLHRCQRLPWHRVPVLHRTRNRGHGRIELRTLKAVSVQQFGFPPRRPGPPGHPQDPRPAPSSSRRFRTVTVCAITSLTHAQAGPARLADLIRGHWAIEALHHLRDTTFAEDGSQVRTGATPNVIATLRNLVIGVLSRAGPVDVAAALRRHARDPRRPLATLGISLG